MAVNHLSRRNDSPAAKTQSLSPALPDSKVQPAYAECLAPPSSKPQMANISDISGTCSEEDSANTDCNTAIEDPDDQKIIKACAKANLSVIYINDAELAIINELKIKT